MAKQLISGQNCILLLKICIYLSPMIVKAALSKPEVPGVCSDKFLELLYSGSSGKFKRSSVASQAGLPGKGGERGRPVYRDVVVKRFKNTFGPDGILREKVHNFGYSHPQLMSVMYRV
jgi:hypothetical protein